MKKTILCSVLAFIFTAGVIQWKFVPVIAEEEPRQTANVREQDETPGISNGVTLKFVDPDGKPVPKGEIRVWGIAAATQIFDFEEGEIHVEIPEVRPYEDFTFSVFADGFTPYYADWRNSAYDPIPETYTTVLDPAMTLGGTVIDEHGEPIEEAEVRISIPWGKRQRVVKDAFYVTLRSKTDANGHWRCSMIPPEQLGMQTNISLIHPDYADTAVNLGSLNDYQANASGQFPLRQTIMRGVTLRGKVVNETGEPVAGATIFGNLRENSALSPKNRRKTGENGEFVFENCMNAVISGTFLCAGAEGYAPEVIRGFSLRSDAEPVILTLKPGRTVSFNVTDRNNQPVEGVRFNLEKIGDFREYFSQVISEIPVTNADGKTVWENAPTGEFTVEISCAGFMRNAGETIPAGKNEHAFILRRSLVIDCVVFDAETEEPIPQFRIMSGRSASGADQKIFWDGFDTRGGTGGTMEWIENNLWRESSFLLRCEVDGYTPLISPPIPQEMDRYSVKFAMKRPSKEDPDFLQGTIFTPDGSPAELARVGVSTQSRHLTVENGHNLSSGDPWDTATADSRGEFRLSKKESGINEQDYKLLILHDTGFARLAKEEFEKITEPIRLTPWARIEGAVWLGKTLGKQEPVGIHFRPAESDFTQGKPWIQYSYLHNTADENGRFVFDRVFPGEGGVCRIFVFTGLSGRTYSWGYSHTKPYKIAPGETQVIDLGGAGRPVVGKLALPDNWKGEAELRVAVVEMRFKELPAQHPQPQESTWMSPRYCRVDSEGNFRMEDVPAGEWGLTAKLEKHLPGSSPPWTEPWLSGTTGFEIPEIPGGQSDEPFNVGTVKLGLSPKNIEQVFVVQ